MAGRDPEIDVGWASAATGDELQQTGAIQQNAANGRIVRDDNLGIDSGLGQVGLITSPLANVVREPGRVDWPIGPIQANVTRLADSRTKRARHKFGRDEVVAGAEY
jgi:hypothetical protein